MIEQAKKRNIDAGRQVANDPFVAARYKLNDIYCSAWLSHAITALARHKVFDRLPDSGAVSVDVIAAQSTLHSPTLYRVMRALAANGIFVQVDERGFAHNEVSLLLKSTHPNSWRGMSLMWNHPSCLQAWNSFFKCLLDGESGMKHAFGKTLYEHMHDHPEMTAAFSNAMISNSVHAAKSIAKEFSFEKFNSVVDLGGGVGTLLVEILNHHPHLHGCLFECEDLREAATANIEASRLGERCDVVCGDFLKSVPSGVDLYLIKNSMWNWSDEDSLRIMQNVRRAIGERDSTFVIIEYIINEETAPWTTLYDLQILNMPGGRARTLEEYDSLLRAANFEVTSTISVEDQTLVISQPR